MLGTFILLIIFVYPCNLNLHRLKNLNIDIEKSSITLAWLIGLFFLTNILFLATWLREPGYLKPVQGMSFVKLVEKAKDPELLCPTCQVIQTTNSKHCFICNKCIDRYDHHCFWLNNCIGRRNQNLFFMFIVSLDAYFLLMILTGICSKF
jgi:DHHC palmitoyltransferase